MSRIESTNQSDVRQEAPNRVWRLTAAAAGVAGLTLAAAGCGMPAMEAGTNCDWAGGCAENGAPAIDVVAGDALVVVE